MASERRQPVVVGTDPRGELLWGSIEMPRWQMLMFPIKYVGDFAAFWFKRVMLETMGCEPTQDIPNASFRLRKFGRVRRERLNTGD
jgi:hypothetical protein